MKRRAMGQPEQTSSTELRDGAKHSAGESSRKRTAMLIGFAATLAVAVMFLCGLSERIELMCLSFRQTIAAQDMPAGDIICVDIDDGSIAKIGRWPWPREILAGTVDILKLCGAKTIAFDIICPDPQALRYVAPSGMLYEAQESQSVFNTQPTPVFDDLLFARAMKSAGNVFLPVHMDNVSEIKKEQLELEKAVDAIFNKATTEPTFEDVRKLLPAANEEMLTRVWLRKKSLQYCAPFELNYLAEELPRLNCPQETGYVQPPLASLSQAMGGMGFVTFRSDIDGVVRSQIMLAKDGEKIFPQFALSIAACEIGNCPIGNISFKCKDREINFIAQNGMERNIPLDPKGRLLVKYSAETWREGEKKSHISVASVVFVWDEMVRRKNLDELQMQQQLKFVTLGFGEDVNMAAEFEAIHTLTQKRNLLFERKIAAQRAAYRNELFGGQPAEKVAANLAAATAELANIQTQLTVETARVVEKISADENLLKTYAGDNIAQAREIISTLKSLPGERKRLDENIKKCIAELAEHVKDRICLIGSTSTGAADFVPTPLGQRTPGMVVHANLINNIVQDSFLRQAPWWLSLGMIILCGCLSSLAAARQGILTALLVTITFAVAYTVFNVYTIFVQRGVWMELVSVVAAMFASFVAVTIFRELTEERAKRKIKAMFAHALSPELVEQLMADPSIAQLGGQDRHITCMFSDLAGFTSLSGRLGANDTVKLLNRYFDCVTEIVQKKWSGYINKFLGDGVFAIFGAPVHQENHPALAVRAAIEYSGAVADLNSNLQEEGFDNAALKVRIGLTSDNAMVGNCGSSQRMDYTAIGSVVNLASRLEAANKFFGTCILAEKQVIAAGGDDVVARCMGSAMINGVDAPVETWNVIGRRDELPSAVVTAAKNFTQGVQLMQQRDFARAAELFVQARDVFGPEDKPSAIFLKMCENALNSPNPAEYQPADVNSSGVIRLII